jgi:uncharacterized C2H2 Zn-finger protein
MAGGSMNNLDKCPHCGTNLRRHARGDRQYDGYSRAISIEIQGVYDGALFTACPDCHQTWHRWSRKDNPRLWHEAERHSARFVACMFDGSDACLDNDPC